ncbi:MAG: hypothetical protein KJ025_20425 [Burkholderiales bacterium]|nr:hypothetical protein [Burkholderiales bacterium]
MESFLQHPAVQGGVAPFVAGLIVAALLGRARLGGLAVAAGYAVAIALVSGIAFSPLTALRKIALLALAAPLAGIAIDFALRSGRALALVVAAICGGLTIWVFWSVLQHKAPGEAALLGGGAALYVAWLVAATMTLSAEPVRAGAAALVLGLGTGISAILAASALLGLYGIGLAAGAGGFLLWQMVTGRRIAAGATLTLSAAVAGGLFGAAALFLAKLPWHVPIVLALVPLAARLPVPARFPIWAQAILLSVYCFVLAVIAFLLTSQGVAPPA